MCHIHDNVQRVASTHPRATYTTNSLRKHPAARRINGEHYSASPDQIMTKPGTGIIVGPTSQHVSDRVALLQKLTDEYLLIDLDIGSPC